MNPIEQVWKELRKSFRNEVFATLEKVMDRLCEAICQMQLFKASLHVIGLLKRLIKFWYEYHPDENVFSFSAQLTEAHE